MSRRLRLTHRYQRARTARGITPGTPVGRAVAAEIARLLAAEILPCPSDRRALMPPTAWAYTRRVRGRNLWLWYVPRDGEVALVGLTADPPVEADE